MFISKSKAVRKIVVAAAVLFAACFMVMPSARADIFKVENVGDTCSGAGSAGGGLCNLVGGTYVPFSLSALVGPSSGHGIGGTGGIDYAYLESLAPGAGTINFIVEDDYQTSIAFSFIYTDSMSDNAHCSLNGGTSANFDGCSIVQTDPDSHGLTSVSCSGAGCTSPQFDHYLNPPDTVTFDGSNLLGQTFELEFVSMQGLGGTTVHAPEPSSVALLGMGMFGLLFFGLRQRKALPEAA